MKTANLEIELMTPSQLNKDIIFNEALLKIDNFIPLWIEGFIETLNDDLNVNKKYIITKGTHRNKICYRSMAARPVEFHTPKIGMLVFHPDCGFLYYNGENWVSYTSTAKLPVSFSGIRGEITLRDKNNYLHLNSDVNFRINNLPHAELNIFLKQAHDNIYSVNWPANIMWENRITHVMSDATNSIDFIKLYYLPETNHYLGKIIGQNFNY